MPDLVKILSSTLRAERRIRVFSRGSTPKLKATMLSVTRFIQRIWTGCSIKGAAKQSISKARDDFAGI